ncbi:acyl-CoA dehydrogenase family protein [bacterium]|nr:acyl-CoA dehydrogenase family protein [bacterium]
MSVMDKKTQQPGISFLTHVISPQDAGFPEDKSSEQRELQEAVRAFLEGEVVPRLHELDEDRDAHAPDLLRQFGEIGLFMAEVEEEFGGLGLGIFSAIAMIEELGRAGSFGVAAMVQQGIGMQPTMTYGTEEQRAAHLPGLADASVIGAYALTEPSSGSDALSAKTTAVRDGDHWILNGTKQFITNAAWAGLYTVFAQVDGNKLTAFLVPREAEGFSVLDEEDKMGIKGSSTCGLKLENVRVPDSARLGDIGRGHKIALNMLNLGRLKLGATMLGANKRALREAIRYGMERKQFGQPLVSFGMIRQKIADCAALIFAGEAIAYRTSRLIEDTVEILAPAEGKQAAKRHASEEFNVECAIAKIFLTEGATRVADHAVQMLGGYGFCEEYPVARNYRDVRVSRLYEGTNEINRMVVVNSIMRRSVKESVVDQIRARKVESGDRLAAVVEELRQVFARAVEAVLAKLGDPKKLRDEQELLAALAEMAIQIYVADSAAMRSAKMAARDDVDQRWKDFAHHAAMLAVANAGRETRNQSESLFAAVMEPEAAAEQIASAGRLFVLSINRVEHERALAAALIELEGEWPELAPAPEE